MRPGAWRAGGLSLPGRLLRLELRRGAMLWMLPLVAALGFAMRFPAGGNAVAASVPPVDVGVAAGANKAFNAMRGVFGIAALAAVFARRLHHARIARRRVQARGMGRGGSRLFGLVAAALAPPTSEGKEEAER